MGHAGGRAAVGSDDGTIRYSSGVQARSGAVRGATGCFDLRRATLNCWQPEQVRSSFIFIPTAAARRKPDRDRNAGVLAGQRVVRGGSANASRSMNAPRLKVRRLRAIARKSPSDATFDAALW